MIPPVLIKTGGIVLSDRRGIPSRDGENMVRAIGLIDLNIFSCISKDIATSEVILTDERIDHINDRHPGDFERYGSYIPFIVEEPDYIIEDEKPGTALLLKEFIEDQVRFRLTLKLQTEKNAGRKNSVLTFQYVRKKEYDRLIRNKMVLYKRQGL